MFYDSLESRYQYMNAIGRCVCHYRKKYFLEGRLLVKVSKKTLKRTQTMGNETQVWRAPLHGGSKSWLECCKGGSVFLRAGADLDLVEIHLNDIVGERGLFLRANNTEAASQWILWIPEEGRPRGPGLGLIVLC